MHKKKDINANTTFHMLNAFSTGNASRRMFCIIPCRCHSCDPCWQNCTTTLMLDYHGVSMQICKEPMPPPPPPPRACK